MLIKCFNLEKLSRIDNGYSSEECMLGFNVMSIRGGGVMPFSVSRRFSATLKSKKFYVYSFIMKMITEKRGKSFPYLETSKWRKSGNEFIFQVFLTTIADNNM